VRKGGREGRLRLKNEPSWRDDESSYFVLFERNWSTEDLLDDGDHKGERLSRSSHRLSKRETNERKESSRSASRKLLLGFES